MEGELKSYTLEEVKKHNKPDDNWIIVKGKVFDVSKFANVHPGGKTILHRVAGTDATKQFVEFHKDSVLTKYTPKLCIGTLTDGTKLQEQNLAKQSKNFGELIPFGDPSWYQGMNSLFYKDSHRRLRQAVREHVETNIMPYCYEWDESKNPPLELFKKAAEINLIPSCVGGKWPIDYAGPKILGNVPPEEYDYFHELIIVDELTRCGCSGVVLFLIGGNGIGIPPIYHFGSQYLKDKVLKPVFAGDKRACLAITEPSAGSDVANLKCVAKKTEDGRFYIVNGEKKWITGGIYADFFTTAVRTGGPSMGGLSMLVIEKDTPGVKTRRMECSGLWGSGTTYITFEDVKVPVENIVGKENSGFKIIMFNFNHERWGVCVQAIRLARVCFEEAFKYAHKRKAFGQRLVENPLIRSKLGNMIRQIEATFSWLEHLTYQMSTLPQKEAMIKLASPIALLKVQSTTTLDYCAKEAVQIFGGLGFTRGGQGEKVERIYRETRAFSIFAGSEEVMTELGVRQIMRSKV